MIGSIIGGALNIGASIFGGIKQAKAMKNVQKNLQNQMAENQNWYDRRYNEDATQRADAQRLITMTEESIKNRNKQAAGSAAVMYIYTPFSRSFAKFGLSLCFTSLNPFLF